MPKQTHGIKHWIEVLSAAGAVVTFLWGVIMFSANQRAQAETRRIEATRPFLERQLKLYTEATQTASTIAASESIDTASVAIKRFWELYWGELALVEDGGVESAMVEFGRALKDNPTVDALQSGALALAHACRNSLAESWGVQQWRNPQDEPGA